MESGRREETEGAADGMNAGARISNCVRDPSPCKGCTERFTACADRCPIDARGEYGINAWHEQIKRVKEEKQKYLNRANVRRKHYGGYYGQE